MAKHARGDFPNPDAGDIAIHDHHRPSAVPARHAAPHLVDRRRMVGAAVAVVVGLVGAYVLVSQIDFPATDAAVAQARATSPILAPSPQTATTAPSPVVSAQPAAATVTPTSLGSGSPATVVPPPASLPESGPGLTQPGILLIASPEPDGSVTVHEQVRLDDPVGALTLRPAPVERAGRQFSAASAAATQVTLTAGGQSVPVPGEVGAATTVRVTGVDQFEVRYQLTDVTVRSTPSTAGRALTVLGPLTGGVDDELPVRIMVSGNAVLGLSCPLLPFSEQACGKRITALPGLEHELPARLALTTVQLDLAPA